MTKKSPSSLGGKAAAVAAGAIGSAAIAAAMLYASKRKEKAKGESTETSSAPRIPSGEQPETD